MSEDALTLAMSDKDLEEFKAKNPDNESIITLVDGILTSRKTAKEADEAMQAFTTSVEELTAGLVHPEAIHNVHLRWAEVEIEDKSQPVEEVEIIDSPAVAKTDTSPAVKVLKHIEKRYPMVKVNKWLVELNKGFTVGKSTNDTPTTSKRAVTVNKRNGQVLEFVGNFASAKSACEYLKIDTGGDSATRVLNRDGYILDAYTGTDYTS